MDGAMADGAMADGPRWDGTSGVICKLVRMEVSPVQLLIFQPTPFCNLNCTYCYLPDRQDKRTMSVDIVRTTIRKLKDEGLLDPELSIVWHAGEPTVARRERYAEYFAAVKEVLGDSCAVVHHFQTNATLIDNAWCDFIKEHRIAVGVSIDGPDYSHDRSRTSWSGRGTLDKTLRGIKALQENEIEFHTISVIGEHSLEHAKEIYEFLVSLKPVLLAFNVEEQEGVHQNSSLTDRTDRVERFFRELYYLGKANSFEPPIREFENACGSIAAGGGKRFQHAGLPVSNIYRLGGRRFHHVLARVTRYEVGSVWTFGNREHQNRFSARGSSFSKIQTLIDRRFCRREALQRDLRLLRSLRWRRPRQ